MFGVLFLTFLEYFSNTIVIEKSGIFYGGDLKLLDLIDPLEESVDYYELWIGKKQAFVWCWEYLMRVEVGRVSEKQKHHRITCYH